MTKFEMIILCVVACVCIFVGWTDDGGWAHRLALLWGGINLGAVFVYAMDEKIGDEHE